MPDLEKINNHVVNKKKFKTELSDQGRVCTYCLTYKFWEEFNVHSRSKTGRTSKCKVCKNQKKKSAHKDPKKESYNQKRRKKQLKKEEPFEYKARNLRNRLLARLKDPEDPRRLTTPTKSEIKSWLEGQELVCYYSGEKLDLFTMHVDHKQPFNRGGTNELSNLCICTSKMNTAKGGLSEKEFKDLLLLVSKWEDKGEALFRRLRQGFYS